MRTLRSAAKQRGWAWVPWAIGAVAGAIAGDKARKATHQANDSAIELANTSIQRRVADAKAAGIHPLYALNATGASTPTIQAGDYGWISQAGQDLSRAMTAGQENEERKETLREKARIDEKRLSMEREMHELEMQIKRAQLFRLQTDPATAPATPSPVSSGNVPGFSLLPPAPNPASSPVGLAPKSTPGMQRYYAGDTPWDLPNSDLAEVLEGMGAAGHVVGPLMMWDHVRSRDMRERALQYEEAYKALGPPRKGHYWKYDAQLRAWRELPKQR